MVTMIFPRANPTVTSDNLKTLANEILLAYPSELIRAATCLANTAELAIQARPAHDMSGAYNNIAAMKRILRGL